MFYAILLLSLLRCKTYRTIYYYYITMKTSQSNPMTSWDELLAALDNASINTYDALWQIYWYLKSMIGKEPSINVRMLLTMYMYMREKQPTVLNSLMLGLAVKCSVVYGDFNFARFLKIWRYPSLLRDEDRQPGKNPHGKPFLSLQQRTDRALQVYMLHHPAERIEQTEWIRPMLAARFVVKEIKGRKHTFVILVDTENRSLLADCRQLPCRINEIQGKLFDVLIRTSTLGVERVDEIVLSNKQPADIFPLVTGYVKGFDEKRVQYHIYDAQSRHFVAERPTIPLTNGSYVLFIPFIPVDDNFKMAVIQGCLSKEEGRLSFGQMPATVLFVNKEKGYLKYRLDYLPETTPEGVYTFEGYADLSAFESDTPISTVNVGDRLELTLFLKRGKDGVKRNFVPHYHRLFPSSK